MPLYRTLNPTEYYLPHPNKYKKRDYITTKSLTIFKIKYILICDETQKVLSDVWVTPLFSF